MATFVLIWRSTDEANATMATADFTGETPVVTDGPYGGTKELFHGFYILDVASKEESVEWAKRVPSQDGTKVEIRRVPSIDEFPQGQRVGPQGTRVARVHRTAVSVGERDDACRRGGVVDGVVPHRRHPRAPHRRRRRCRGPRAGVAGRRTGELASHGRPPACDRCVPAPGGRRRSVRAARPAARRCGPGPGGAHLAPRVGAERQRPHLHGTVVGVQRRRVDPERAGR